MKSQERLITGLLRSGVVDAYESVFGSNAKGWFTAIEAKRQSINALAGLNPDLARICDHTLELYTFLNGMGYGDRAIIESTLSIGEEEDWRRTPLAIASDGYLKAAISPAVRLVLRSLGRDLQTISERMKSEGLGFATKILPRLGVIFDRSLDGWSKLMPEGFTRVGSERALAELSILLSGTVISTEADAKNVTLSDAQVQHEEWVRQAPPGESQESGKHVEGGVPCFMAPLFILTHDAGGILRPDACPETIRSIRTVCYLCYKLEVKEWSDDVTAKCSESYRDVDRSLPLSQEKASTTFSQILNLAGDYIGRVLGHKVLPTDITPNHGPGAVAEKLRPWEKVSHRSWLATVERAYDLTYAVSGMHGLVDDQPSWQDSGASDGIARVCLVPKDSRGPRVITCEPVLLQWLQQGLRRKLVELIESPTVEMLEHPEWDTSYMYMNRWVTRRNPCFGEINISSQEVNRQLARKASTGEVALATIDMKDASDRVSASLIARLFPAVWRDALFSVRSKRALLPTGQVMVLRKYAGMGNACTFPLEALCFWGIARATSLCLFGEEKPVYVYGDDIIMDPELVPYVVQSYTNAGLKVNEAKSFITGPFRESCGMDAFKGEEVNPLRLKKILGLISKIVDPASIVSATEMCNEAWDRGNCHLATRLRRELDSAAPEIPNIPLQSVKTLPEGYRLPGLHTHITGMGVKVSPIRSRWNKRYQQTEYRVPLATGVIVEDEDAQSRGWSLVLRGLITLENNKRGNSLVPSAAKRLDPDQYALPKCYKIKWGWCTPVPLGDRPTA